MQERHVLGMSCRGFHASACLLGEQGVRVAICEERLSRLEQDRRFPLAAIEYCLDAGGLDAVIIGNVLAEK